MTGKKFRMFVGPNGSGKSTLIEEISREFNIGYFINADKIEVSLNSQRYLDCSDFFPNPVSNEELERFLTSYKKDERFRDGDFKGIEIRENFLICHQEIKSYHAAVIGEFRSLDLLSDAFLAVDRAFIIDSSNKNRDVILEKRNREILLHQESIPDWVADYLLEKLKLY